MAKKQITKKRKAVSSRIKKQVKQQRAPRKTVRSKSVKRLRPVDVGRIQGRLLYSVSERHVHPEVLRHRANETRADGLELLKAMENRQ